MAVAITAPREGLALSATPGALLQVLVNLTFKLWHFSEAVRLLGAAQHSRRSFLRRLCEFQSAVGEGGTAVQFCISVQCLDRQSQP